MEDSGNSSPAGGLTSGVHVGGYVGGSSSSTAKITALQGHTDVGSLLYGETLRSMQRDVMQSEDGVVHNRLDRGIPSTDQLRGLVAGGGAGSPKRIILSARMIQTEGPTILESVVLKFVSLRTHDTPK